MQVYNNPPIIIYYKYIIIMTYLCLLLTLLNSLYLNQYKYIILLWIYLLFLFIIVNHIMFPLVMGLIMILNWTLNFKLKLFFRTGTEPNLIKNQLKSNLNSNSTIIFWVFVLPIIEIWNVNCKHVFNFLSTTHPRYRNITISLPKIVFSRYNKYDKNKNSI